MVKIINKNQEKGIAAGHTNCAFVLFFLASLFAAFSCGGSSALDHALQEAGDNRHEWERVLEHYRDSGLKYEAARFLIENMPGCHGTTRQTVQALQPLYQAYDSINQAYHFQLSGEWGQSIDGLYERFPHLVRSIPRMEEDLQVLTADYLIREIDRSFEAWNNNVYPVSFRHFCEYVLPYRRYNGILVDQARDTFYQRHKAAYYAKPGKHWLEETDSLLFVYSRIRHSEFWGSRIPVWDAGTLERLGYGLCMQRCWFNALLLSSLGMPVAIDFVPAWGNRNNSHSWDVVVTDSGSYAFEAFWDTDRWKYRGCVEKRTFFFMHQAPTFTSQGFVISQSFCIFRH